MNNTCPACNGTTRRPAAGVAYASMTWGYDKATDSLPCTNCGGQTMSGTALGTVPIDPATGLGCLHSYRGVERGRCYRVYTCVKCGDRYDIDSGD